MQERVQFDGPIARFQRVQDVILQMDIALERNLTWLLHLVRAYDEGKNIREQAAKVKIDSSRVASHLLASPQGARYEEMTGRLDEALRFMEACGLTPESTPQLAETDFYTSHEALLLPYEQALTRRDSLTGRWYDVGAHMLWIGDRTRQPDGAHVEFLRGVENPIGLKAGPSLAPDDLLVLMDILDPDSDPGRLTIVARMGADDVGDKLPPLIRAVEGAGRKPHRGRTYPERMCSGHRGHRGCMRTNRGCRQRR